MAIGQGRGVRFLEALSQGPLLLDAALGTRLIARGLKLGQEEPSTWNLSRPEIVRELHQRDALAGADAVLTNTFGANRVWLDRFGMAEELEPINRQAATLARAAVGPDRFVLGSIGPTAASTAPPFQANQAEREQAHILAEAGVDALILETNPGHADPGQRVRALQADTGLPILYSLYSWQVADNVQLQDLVHSLLEAGVAAIGCNCRVGMAEMIHFANTFGPLVGQVPLLVKPGAGLPEGPLETPETFAKAVPTLQNAKVRLFGGCCGTTEAHIAKLRSALDRHTGNRPSAANH